MIWRNVWSASGGSLTSTMGSCRDSVGGGCGIENISLNTGDASDSMSLWAWNSFPPETRRMTSASGGVCYSAVMMRVGDKEGEPLSR